MIYYITGCTDSAQERTGILSAANHSHQSIVKPSSNGSASPPITTQNTAAKKPPVSLKRKQQSNYYSIGDGQKGI